MKAAIYGAGAMGSALGTLIVKSGGAVDLYARNEKHVAAVRQKGLTLRCEADRVTFTVNAPIFTPDELKTKREKYDVIFLMTKQRENPLIVAFLKAYLTDGGVLVTTQNGLPEQKIADILGAEKTFGGVCSFGANFIGAGEAALTSSLASAKICVGAYERGGATRYSEAAGYIRSLLKPVGDVTGGDFYRETENLAGVRYAKLTLNAAFSSISAATGMTFGEAAKYSKTKKIALGIMREVLAVAEKTGVRIDTVQGRDIAALLKKGGAPLGWLKEAFLRLAMPHFVRTHKHSVSGMLEDIKRGRKCEIDFITGAVSAEGKRAGVATPLCDKVTEIVHGVENGLYELSVKNAAFFD
ncbi:MAG: 2-dehydropantoate 2-reductase [Candidatus Borkfalkiaceae bacterium]|nr:2-dehydropantoate 2-reductase [Clostridia bacterium]MDY6223737.1 2-dehydropantoate 2-reductase [Christensenellaceae bacterium]